LTDKYPNVAAFQNARRKTGGQITFYSGFVDAAALPHELSGFRTIFTSLHHFTPDEALAILQHAADLTAPFARPFRISRIFWTYFIPVIPFVLVFDGVISCLRAYSKKELSLLAAQVKAENWLWQVG